MSKNKIRVMIVDDIAETSENIRKLLQFEDDVEVVGTAYTGEESIKQVSEIRPDVILMDINMPGRGGIYATKVITTKFPNIQVVILSVQNDQNYMRNAMLAGAWDFLTKPPMGDELISAVRRAGHMAKSKEEEKEKERLLFREKQLLLTLFDLYSRLDLYQDNLVAGKLVDELEMLVSGLAHDIRSPINIVLSILSTIDSDKESIINAVKKIWRRSMYCKWTADNFLGISLSEKISVRNRPLKAIVKETISLLENRIPPELKLINNIEDNVEVAVDIGLLQLTLLNLLSNSLESMLETGQISIYIETLNNKTAIFVEDNGAPISDEHVRQLFKLGFTTKEAHAGIGLYVSKRLLKQQNGDLYFARDFRNSTKIFGVLLPNLAVGSADSLIAMQKRVDEEENLIKNVQDDIAKLRSQDISEAQQATLSKEFQRLTNTFSKNLSNELLLIEATVLDAMQKLSPDNISTEKAFRKVIRNCAYCRLLTNNILALGEGATPEMENLSLIDIVEEVLSLIDRKMPPHLYSVEWEVDPLLPNIKADSLQMKQVFMNLIKNALDAMPSGGVLKLKLTAEEHYAIAEIGDTGIGISPENLSNLFQLGFTTKLKGYGIGLFSVKKIIEKHNGKIEVSSIESQGTTFKIKLPLTLQEEE